jgi:agmatinase
MSDELSFYTYRKLTLPLSTMQKEGAEALLLGIPFDGTQTGMTGSRIGPTSIRSASYELELFDLETGIDLSKVAIYDMGDISCVFGSSEQTLERIRHTAAHMPRDALWVMLGGEHSISLPLIESLNPDLVVSFDAHPDLQSSYMGVRDSHASVMRRVHERGIDVAVIGAREGSREEYEYARDNGIPLIAPMHSDSFEIPEGKRVYISVDLDVFDNVRVGNPIPGGMPFNEVCGIIASIMEKSEVVGIDIVELCGDTTDPSAYLGAKLLYKLLAYWKSQKT